MKKFLALAGLLVSFNLWAAPEDDIRTQLTKLDANMPILSIEPISLKGFYAVALASGEVLYVDETAEYVLSGDLFQVQPEGGLANLTEERLKAFRREGMKEIADADMIIYPAKGEKKYRLAVFTDIDYPYCRKFHEEVPALNEMGVEIAYLAFPRSGSGTKTAINMVSIWCAEGVDARRAALDAAKSGEPFDSANCDSPVNDQFVLGQRFGVTGTPSLLLEDGGLVPGYVPAARLKQMLNL